MDSPNLQNIFDNEAFFAGYAALRKNPANYNIQIEHPAMEALLPDLDGKSVLDLGCGFGENCETYRKLGAREVLGIDLSEKMLAVARAEHSGSGIAYRRMDMTEIASLNRQFDVVVSSLAIHYIRDYASLLRDICSCLAPQGIFLYSQEHPLVTAPQAGPDYAFDPQTGAPLYYRLDHYACGGERSVEWFVEDVRKYHRTFSELVNTILQTGFRILQMEEPVPPPEMVQAYPAMEKEYHKPSFLIFKLQKAADGLGGGSPTRLLNREGRS